MRSLLLHYLTPHLDLAWLIKETVHDGFKHFLDQKHTPSPSSAFIHSDNNKSSSKKLFHLHQTLIMKSSTIGFTLLHLASLCYSAPGTSYVNARQAISDTVTFQGAGPNPPSYTLNFPCDGSNVTISMSPFSYLTLNSMIYDTCLDV